MFEFMCIIIGVFVVPFSMLTIYVILKFLHFFFGGSTLENLLDI